MSLRLLITVLLILLPMGAQEKKIEEIARLEIPNAINLKVLKVTSGAEVSQIMRTFTAGLGVQCSYCHADGGFASDENPKKEVARRMIKMAQTINANFTDGKMHVSCYTCHRGETQPKTAPAPEVKPAAQ